EGLPSNALINVYKIENELIFTTPNGPYIFDYKSNTFKLDSVLSQYEVINDPLNFLADDAKGNIYFLTQSNMGVLTKKLDGSYEPKINIFNKVHSMLNNDLVNISVLNSNNILFGAKEGFIVYNPSIENAFENNFGTYIRNVSITSDADSTIFGGNFKRGDNIIANQPDDQAPVLGYNNNSLKFTYSADFMDNFDKTEYQFFLEGFESNWSPWSSQIEKEYTNLFEGYYIFRVKAKNINNIESSETSYAFEILPPWYRSKLAYVAYLIIIATFITIAIVIIDRKYKESKRSFEKKKQLEVDEIDSKLKSVTQETTQKIEKLKSEKLQSEVELKNVELASSTMNLINKNEFISSIKSNLTSISKKSKSQEVIKELGKITHEIDKNISHDDDWKQFAFHFNKVHGNFTTRLTSEYHNLSAQDLRLCSYLRLNLSTKEIAQLLNISVRGVEISRYRLRKKLALNRSDNLSEFILNY
ncbi:MAG: two component regulator three y domain-containing protein, partial [Bacteroidetes bacterium]